jgi:predicted glycosyltransferase
MKPRVLFYVQHLLGVGHVKRAEILAAAMAAAGLEVTVALGGKPMPEAPFAGVTVAELPPATIANEDFSALLDADGRPVDDAWKTRRRAALLGVYQSIAPDAVLIELYPFGRRQFVFELVPLLELVRRSERRPRVACSVRDVLVASRKPGRDAEVAAIARRFFDAVLVHGDPALIPFDATFPAASEIADLIRYTGYVAGEAADGAAPVGHDEVIVSAGGGAVGAPLLLAALAARPATPLAGKVWRFIAGPNLAEPDYRRLAATSDDRTVVERFRYDFPSRLGAAALSISQAGYNTTMDILRTGARAVVVPYETAGETEQRLRADILERKGLLTVVPAADLSAERLVRGVAEALAKPRPRAGAVNLSGAAATASMVGELAGRGMIAALDTP